MRMPSTRIHCNSHHNFLSLHLLNLQTAVASDTAIPRLRFALYGQNIQLKELASCDLHTASLFSFAACA
jgi:hypothetical protein